MPTQTFVGDKPVEHAPEEATRKIPDEALTEREAERLAKGDAKEPGANKRAGAASRDPSEYDTKNRGGQGDTKPTAGKCTSFPWTVSSL
ncbi:hypothetical protein F5I97DRAFT_1810220 [Phlebopus sp. FC_14]|nr:hypothetical protein F5I97DRAFT_1810220 [Phlebopus sp. FC_14]